MSWLSKHLGIKLDSHTLGNLLKNVSPAAALIPGVGPLAAAGIAAGASALGDVGRGKSPSLGSAITNAGLAYGGSGLLHSLGGAGSAASAGGSVAPGAAPSSVSIGGISLPAPTAASLPANPSWVQSLAGTSGGGGTGAGLLSKIGGFVEAHPNATGMGLQGLGQLGQAVSGSGIRRAEEQALNQQNALSQYQFDRLKQQNIALDPIRQALLGHLTGLGNGMGFTPAPNPYSSGYGGAYSGYPTGGVP